MRHTGAENIPHVAWTDHRILRLPAPPDTSTEHPQSAELSPVFSPGATQRDLAMAYYKALLEGNSSVGPKAWNLLQAQRSNIGNDADALDAYGLMSAQHGDNHDAEEAFQQVLKLDPHDLTALSNLGTLEAKQGRLKSSVAMLQLAFEANKDVIGLAMNLARVQCMDGDAEGARSTLDSALIYAPGRRGTSAYAQPDVRLQEPRKQRRPDPRSDAVSRQVALCFLTACALLLPGAGVGQSEAEPLSGPHSLLSRLANFPRQRRPFDDISKMIPLLLKLTICSATFCFARREPWNRWANSPPDRNSSRQGQSS